MPNKNYIKGRRKEYAIVNKLKAESFIAQRSAGSHSPFDVVAIHPKRKVIMLIQSKPDTMSENQIKKLEEENKALNGLYFVRFLVQ